ncbi:autotransporter-associated beta strand repeat-containing protein [Haloferula sp. BvORR071]|uniref:beta strand repeat-containing protein n=1 Tax=Haloferula sp. BvORR071 TaxID=1396141 RepID=UPI0005561F94|nr:autotransporter-associated beta strand repeat-containing protein [Haloferula sp. BvORR071]
MFLNRASILRAALLTASASLLPATAADLYFDTNGATAGSGNAAGAWNTGTTWTTDVTGASATVAWTNGQSAIFSAGTDGVGTKAVTITGTVATPLIQLKEAGMVNITGGSIDITGGSVFNTSVVGAATGRSLTWTSAVTGTGPLNLAVNGDTTNTGGGSNVIFALTGTNTFTGDVTISSGVVGYTSNFGNAANKIILDGGGIVFNTTGNFTRNIEAVVSGGVLRNYGAANSTLSGTLSGTGNIRRTDGGTAILTGDGTGFSGGLLIERGTVQVGNGTTTTNLIPNVASVTLGDGSGAGTLRYQLDGSMTLATPVIFANTGSVLAWQGTDSGDVLTINNAAGPANNSGSLRVNSGAINLASGADALFGTVSVTSTPANSATAVVGNLNILPGSLLGTSFFNIGDGANTAGVVNQSGGTVTLASGSSGFRLGHWANGLTPGSIYNLSGGTLDASGLNANTGAAQLISVGWDGAGAMTVGGGAGPAVLKAPGLQFDQSRAGTGNSASTFTLSPNGTFEIGTRGTLAAGTNDFVYLNGGKIVAANATTLATPMVANASTTSTFDLNGTTSVLTAPITGTGTLSLTDSLGGGMLELSQPSGSRTITAGLAGTLDLRKTGAGSVNLTGNNTLAGTVYVDAGRLDLNGTNAIKVDVNDGVTFGGEGSTTGTLSLGVSGGANLAVDPTTPGAFHAGGGLSLNGINNIALSVPFSGTTNILTYGGSLTGNLSNLALPGQANYRSASVNFSPGVISLTINNKDLVWTGTGGGLWDLNTTGGFNDAGAAANNFFWGDNTRFDDTAAVTAVAITGELAPGKITVDADTNAFTITGGAGNFISGIGSLYKTGSSTLTINAPNTFSGGTIISEGAIAVTGTNGGLGTGSVTLGDAATGASSVSLLLGNGRGMANPITVSSLATGQAIIGFAGTGVNYTEFTGPVALQRDVTLRSGTTDRLHFGGVISGTGNLTIDGGKRVTMSGSNTFTGNVAIRDAGTIFQTFGGNPIPDASSVDVGPDAIFQVYTSETMGALTGTGFMQPIAGKPTLTVGSGNASGTFAGTLRPQGSDHLNITKTGTGTETFSGSIQSPGSFTVSGGILELTGTAAFGRNLQAGSAMPTRALQGTSGTIRVAGSSADVTLRRNSTGLTAGITLAGGTTTVGHNLALATAPVTINGGSLRFDNSGTYFTALANSVLTAGTLSSDTTTNNLATLHAVTGDVVPGATTHIYNGFIYLTAGQWSFGENFDDGASIVVNGTQLFNDAVYNTTTTGTFNAPDDGWYSIDVRAYQGAGAAGGNGAWGTAGIGIGIRKGASSTDVADYVALTDGALGTRLVSVNSFSFSNTVALTGTGTFDTSTMVGQPGVAGSDGNGTGGDVTLTGVISGAGSLVKSGTGTLVLAATNTYTGNTTVNGGRLTLGTASLADASDVSIAAGAILNLTHGANDTVHSLFINGVGMAPGTYNATTNPASFSGSGSLVVTTAGSGGTPYGNWATANGITGAGGNVDSDGDRIPNGIEFVIGGDPSGPGSASSALLPTVTTDANYLTIVYRRADASVTYNPRVQYSTALAQGGWTNAVNGQPSGTPVVITEENDAFATGIDRVTVKIPRALAAPGTKLFGRLTADVP